MGATATGKSEAGIFLAERFDGEVVSMDSRQVYRRMDVGTGKVSTAQQARVPHHLIDFLDPAERSSAGRHAALVASAAEGICERGRIPILAGGTGLYFRSFFEGLIDVVIPRDVLAGIRAGCESRETTALYEELRLKDPERAQDLSANDRIRITRALELIAWTGRTVTELYSEERTGARDWSVLSFVLTMPRHLLRGKIAGRTRDLFARGWVDEVEGLLASGVALEAPGMNSLGYREIAAALRQGEDASSVLEAVVMATQQYAKRQETFFRRDKEAVWIDVSESGWLERMAEQVGSFVSSE